jgi:hypothetical protein
MKLYRVTLTKKRRDMDGVHLNKEVEHYEVETRAEVLAQVYTRYSKDSVSDILIELIGSNSKASNNGVIEPLGENSADGIDA